MSSPSVSVSTKVLMPRTPDDDMCDFVRSLSLICCYNTEMCCSVQTKLDSRRDMKEKESLHENSYTDRHALVKSFSPLFTSMKIFGVYFNIDDGTDETEVVSSSDTAKEHEQVPRRRKWSCGKIYGAVALVLQWLNVIRLTTSFSSSDKFEARLTYKLVAVAQALLCASMHTSYFIACSSGRLNGVLKDLGASPKVCSRMRKRVVILTVLVWCLVVEHLCVYIYFLLFNFEKFDYLVLPFHKIVMINSSYQKTLKIFFSVLSTLAIPAWLFPIAVNHLLSLIISGEFQLVNNSLQQSIDHDGCLTGDLRTLRRRHQSLTSVVKSADQFIMYSNVGGFLCHMIVVIFLLYTFLFHSYAETTATVGSAIALIYNDILMMLTVANGIMVNRAAHSLSDQIYNIDVSNLKATDMNELLIFQKRLSGEPIGFSVFGIFVIDRRTIQSMLGLLITYFLLVVQMSTPTSVNVNHEKNIISNGTMLN